MKSPQRAKELNVEMTEFFQDMSIGGLRSAYLAGDLTPQDLMSTIRAKSEQSTEHNIWIHLLSEDELAPYLNRLSELDIESSPLWGIPFAIKDNIDLAGIPTTAGCEAFAYIPEQSAFVVEQLLQAGAIPVGKTNLDQFATGLNGTRSPYGACKNAFNPDYVSGGSSSGSAVAVALGLATFSLGTDTAGSGRVPAAFNNLIGVKPTRGLLSATGMVPACKSLDCMTIFALQMDDANELLSIAEGYDSSDPYSRRNLYPNQSRQYGVQTGPLKVGVVRDQDLKFFGDKAYESAYQATLDELKDQSDIELVELEYGPFDQAARLLYEGPWVAERFIATESILKSQPEAMFPVVREIVSSGDQPKATDLFSAEYKLNAYKQVCGEVLDSVDVLLTPTAGRFFTIDVMLEEPIKRNSELGYYTNFMNLLDLAALAIPTAMTEKGLPFGVTLVSSAMSDRKLLSVGRRFQSLFDLPMGTSSISKMESNLPAQTAASTIDVMVCGAHLDGLPLNWQLKERGASFKLKTKTAPVYRMYALTGGPPFRPGLIMDESEGAAIEVEVWQVPEDLFGSFVAGIPAPLGIGKVKLADDSWVSGFICEPYAIATAEEITHLGGWRAYMASKSS